jgi:hypothetical protein
MAKKALELIQQHYVIEREVKDLGSELRFAIRHSRSKPIADLMHRWLIAY